MRACVWEEFSSGGSEEWVVGKAGPPQGFNLRYDRPEPPLESQRTFQLPRNEKEPQVCRTPASPESVFYNRLPEPKDSLEQHLRFFFSV